MDTDRIPDFNAEAGERSAQVIQIDNGKHVAAVAVCAALCGIAGALSIWSAYEATQAQKRADLLQYYTMELDGKLMASGVIKPADSWSARQACRDHGCLSNGKTLGESLADHYQQEKSK